MAVFELLLFVLFALNFATMFSGFMLARRMGMYLMMQVMMSMLAMFVGLGTLILGVLGFFTGTSFEILHLLILGDFILILLAFLMEFGQIVPILMKTMQGAPMHSSHITNLIVTLFYSLALVLYYSGLAVL
jgi:hypothetical protein